MNNGGETITDCDKGPNGGNGHAAIVDGFERLHQSAYQAAYGRGWKGGYQEGYDVGRSDALNQETRGTVGATRDQTSAAELRPHRRLLLGLPCTNCGTYFYSDEEQCPRCKTPKA